ncbi:MAG: toprim domain-containing protein [Planctomycetes bacterium]|nr:toprim domain-containing protein [Planctomycetota bacterium]
MDITKEQIESAKQSNDIVTLIRSRGIRLKKKGKNYIGLCPFHTEKTPSFTVDPVKQLYNCFGCSNNGKGSTGGDVIGFVVKHDKVTFKDAIEDLSNSPVKAKQSAVGKKREYRTQNNECRMSNEINTKTLKEDILTPKNQKLLKRVVDFYHTTFTEDDKALKYLTDKRRITGLSENRTQACKTIFTDFKIGFANGTLLKTLPDDGDIINSLKEIGILNQKGNELFYGSVTFPVYDLSDNITCIYGRKITDQENNHMYLPGERRGVFNWQACLRATHRQTPKLHDEIILTESIIDTLTLYNAGYKNTIPCYGTNGLTDDHLAILKKYGVKIVYICFDADETGRAAMGNIIPRLTAINITVYPVTLPDSHDINSFFSFVANPQEAFKTLLGKVNPEIEKATKEPAKEKKDSFIKTDLGFNVTYDNREYNIIGISRADTKLKATIKGIKTHKGKRRFHVDTVDFYSSRSRKLLIGGLVDLFGEGEDTITEDISKIMELLERHRSADGQEDSDKPKTEMTAADKEEALRFLKNPKMFEEIIADFETAGYTGDNTNKLLCYIAAISRKLDNPLSVMIQSRSAAGKSFLQDTVLSFIPEEDYVKYTRLTDQSLFYKEQKSLVHKILAIEEFDGVNGAVYSIRAIQSSGKITIAYTGKDAMTGTMKTAENTVEGPVGFLMTTTAVDIDAETASRFLFMSLDESIMKTEKILEKQREKHTMEGLKNKLSLEKVIKKHHAANRLLKSLYVINPYSKLLTFTTKSIRVHREHDKYLNLIVAIAYLFQYQREIKKTQHKGKQIEYITVTIADIEKAHTIANEVLGNSLEELTTPSRRLLNNIKEMVEGKCKEKKTTPKAYHFTRREIREYADWSDFQIRTHIKELEDMEYIYSVAGKHGREYVYELVYAGGGEDGNRFLIGLIPIEELKKKAKQEGLPVD